ncbi:MAG: hypothetical protein JWM43_621 [Acidobacteriaceae bacterium]|nr:hypothetical protein [Acidobacteriaceae bacterium]
MSISCLELNLFRWSPRPKRLKRDGLKNVFERWQWSRGRAAPGRTRSKKPGYVRCRVDAAVVKVPPPIGCVKYKAQHVVLHMRIPQKWRGSRRKVSKIKDSAVEVSISTLGKRDYEKVNKRIFEGMPRGGQAQGAGVVQSVWTGWKNRKRGTASQLSRVWGRGRGGFCRLQWPDRRGSGGNWRRRAVRVADAGGFRRCSRRIRGRH